MKKNKLFGLLIASGGVIASFALAIAASSIKRATPIEFNITSSVTVSDDGEIRYTVPLTGGVEVVKTFEDEDNAHNAHENYDETYYQLHYQFKLGAQFIDCPAQDFVVGNLSFNFSNVVPSLRNHLAMWTKVQGYKTVAENEQQVPTLGKATYEGAFYADPVNQDHVIDAASKSISSDIGVYADGTNYIDCYIKLDKTADLNAIFFEADEGPLFDLEIVWGAPSAGFEHPVIAGVHNNWDAESKTHRMQPNLDKKASEGWEWYFKGLTGTREFKFVYGLDGDSNHVWYGEGGATGDAANISGLDESTSYNIYWGGAGNASNYGW